MCLFLLSCYSPTRSQNLWASKMICDVTVESTSSEIFYSAPAPDYYIKLTKKHPKVHIKKGFISITSDFNDTTIFLYDIYLRNINDTSYHPKKIVDSNLCIKTFHFIRKKNDEMRFTYLGYNSEMSKHIISYEMGYDYLKTYLFIDAKSMDLMAAFAKPVFSPDRKKIVSFQPGRPDLGHDIIIQEIEEDEIIIIYETPVYKLGDWDIKEIRWIDNNNLVISAKTPRTTSFGGKAIKQKECFYKLSLIKCENQ